MTRRISNAPFSYAHISDDSTRYYVLGICAICNSPRRNLLYDTDVDIIATKDNIRWGIQVKRYSGLVKAEAVRQVVTGLRVYGCDRAMVITNSVFSRVAIQLANSNECVLVDRSGLAKMK